MDVLSNGGIRAARSDELATLRDLVARSFRALATPHYGPDVVEAALGALIRVDPELVARGTYFVAERGGRVVGCGGWSDRVPTVRGAPLPAVRAEVRAMFVDPEWAGSGVGRALLGEAERAIVRAGYDTAHLVATRSGHAFYQRAGYAALGELDAPLPNGSTLALTCMARALL